MIAVASVLLVITPISWILLHQPQNDPADASIPMVTRTDDTYITPSTKAAVATPSARVTTPPTATPTVTPTTTPTTTPSTTPTGSPTDTPTDTPTRESTRNPTTAPTSAPTSTAPTTAPTTPGDTVTSKPPTTPPPTTTPPPPPVDGGMQGTEKQLFDMIDNARVNNGCTSLKQDPSLTTSARSTASSRASSGSNLNGGSGSQAGAGGDKMTVQQAYNQMMKNRQGTILNCSLTTLGVGTDSQPHDTGLLCPLICGTTTRNVWVANFS